MSGKKRCPEEYERMIDAMADEYSLMARCARVEQGLPPVITDPALLELAAELLSPPVGDDDSSVA